MDLSHLVPSSDVATYFHRIAKHGLMVANPNHDTEEQRVGHPRVKLSGN